MSARRADPHPANCSDRINARAFEKDERNGKRESGDGSDGAQQETQHCHAGEKRVNPPHRSSDGRRAVVIQSE